MEWLETTVKTTHEGADAVSDILMRAGALGTQILDREDIPKPDAPNRYWELMDASIVDSFPEGVEVKAWFSSAESLDFAKAFLKTAENTRGLAWGSLLMEVQSVRDEDWAENWKQFYKTFRAGKRLVVKPGWEAYQAAENDLVIDLDPGMAFGTGTHETTRLCLQLIEKHLQQGPVLDIGTGSGILAIAEALLGAEKVLAIDLDPVAVKIASENVQKNKLEGRVTVKKGDLVSGVEGRYAFVSANILADVIILLASALLPHLQAQAMFIASGILCSRAQDVLDALLPLGYRQVERADEGEWTAFAFQAP